MALDDLHEGLKTLAPRTELREGLNSILRARTGGLIVIDDSARVRDRWRVLVKCSLQSPGPVRTGKNGWVIIGLLPAVLEDTTEQLIEVEDIGEVLPRAIREGLRKLREEMLQG